MFLQRLHLLRTGNLVLVDALNLIKWQSFNFPTDVMLWGQRLSSRTRLTSFISSNNFSIFYSFEIQYDKIALYLNSGQWKYTYWEFKPSDQQQNITYVQLTSQALEIFSGTSHKVAEISSQNLQAQPLRFLALSNTTGNLGLYFYSTDKQGFQASYQALNTTCDFPMACKPYGICTFSNACSCIRLGGGSSLSDCNEGISERHCGRNEAEMLELQGITSVLRGSIPSKVNVSHEECASLCLDDCTCVAALYSSNETDAFYQQCFFYGMVRGVKQVERGSKLIYMVKVPKGTHQVQGKSSGLKRWIVILIGVVDGFIILVVLGGIGYYLIQKLRKNSLDTGHPP